MYKRGKTPMMKYYMEKAEYRTLYVKSTRRLLLQLCILCLGFFKGLEKMHQNNCGSLSGKHMHV